MALYRREDSLCSPSRVPCEAWSLSGSCDSLRNVESVGLLPSPSEASVALLPVLSFVPCGKWPLGGSCGALRNVASADGPESVGLLPRLSLVASQADAICAKWGLM